METEKSSRPIRACDLLVLDKRLVTKVLDCYDNPERVIWQAGKNDYSEVPIHQVKAPGHCDAGKWIVDQLLTNDRGHYGPLEHPQITLSCAGFVHSVIVQARTHRIGTSFDVQSQRYTGKRVLKVADRQIDPEDVFYIRPPGFYTNRQGKKYEWTEEHVSNKRSQITLACEQYAKDYRDGFCEEHIRDYLPQAIRQNFVVSFNLRSILHFMDLRSKLDAQLEIEALCESFVPVLREWAPSVWGYYEAKRLHKARLSP